MLPRKTEGPLKVRCLLLLAVLAAVSSLSQAFGSILDTTFNPGTGANGIVEQVLPLSNGKILICGNFTTFNGTGHAYIARLNSNGSVDETFNAQPSYWVRHMSVQTDGKIIIGGYFGGVQGVPRGLIARLNADGSLDTSFDSGAGAAVSIGTAIDGNKDPFVFWTAIQPDGKILATGNFSNYNGNASIGLVRINPDGSRDTSFNVGGGLNSWGRSINILPNNQILVSGWFTNYREKSANRLVRINPDGSPDFGFNPYFGDQTSCYATALTADNHIVVSGHTVNPDGSFARKFERLNWDGSVDPYFVGYTNEKTESLAIQSDGKIIVGGYFNAVDGVARQSVGRVNADGTIDDTWYASIDNYVWTLALQSDGKLLISGGFYTVDGVSRNGVARLLTGVSGGTTQPVAPVLNATANSTTQITLSWTDSATDRSGYSVERKTGVSGTYAAIASLTASARSYVDNSVSANSGYYYRLRATTTSGASVYSNEASATTPIGGGTGLSSATLVSTDATTKGNWMGVYGGDGFGVFEDTSSFPRYVAVTTANKQDWTWQYSTTDSRALQKASNSSDRIAACWYSNTGYQIDLAFNDGQKHRVSLYFLDWDSRGRYQNVKIYDGDTGAQLFAQTINNFTGGIWWNFDLGGHVKFSFTPNSGNAVVSGMFFGPASSGGGGTTGTVATPTISPNGGTFSSAQSVTLADSTGGAAIRYTLDGSDPTASSALYSGPFTVSSSATVKAKGFATGMNASATASATFTISASAGNYAYIGTDTTTKGNWRNVYGADGYNVIGSSFKNPSYISPSGIGKSDWVWNQTTTDTRGLQTADGTSREAGCWYSSGSFTIDLPITDGLTHRVALYLCDWDYAGRTETVELLNADGTLAQSWTVSNFGAGQYLVLDFKGHMQIRFTKVMGPNAVVNGIFFGAPAKQL